MIEESTNFGLSNGSFTNIAITSWLVQVGLFIFYFIIFLKVYYEGLSEDYCRVSLIDEKCRVSNLAVSHEVVLYKRFMSAEMVVEKYATFNNPFNYTLKNSG
jgi:hypothetical protein